mmetsp:Transcript_48970/g.94640  ORF Transcript_48970/g.94640 Transcript_48970/m.94640 type:complete len:446 (-) Transcript_48970:69-1406(-)
MNTSTGLRKERAYVASGDPKPRLHFNGEWDSNPLLHERVCCHAVIRLLHVDTKEGVFTARVKCHWAFRTQNTQDNSEVLMRGVPGIRIPALITTVEESRVWKDVTAASPDERKTNHNTVYWKGTSTFLLQGYKIFHMENFPFDRHVINLENIEFVWRPEKESADYYKSMKVVILTTDLVTVLPEWDTCGAFVKAVRPADTKEYAQTFNWQLRVERQDWFYIRQVFWMSYLMMIVSITPLVIPNREERMGDRLGVYCSGLLTLVAFKYGVAVHLPCVPYATFADDYLNWQITTISMCCFETVISYYSYSDDLSYHEIDYWDKGEKIAFVVLILFWTCYLLFVVFIKRHWKHPWDYVFSKDSLEGYFEVDDPFDYFKLGIAERNLQEAESQKNEYRWCRGFILNILGGPCRHPKDVVLQVTKADAQLRELNSLRGRLDFKQRTYGFS